MNTKENKLVIVTSANLNDVGGPVTISRWLLDNLNSTNRNFLAIELFYQKNFFKCKLINLIIKGQLFLKSLRKLFWAVNQDDVILVNDALGAGVPGLIVSLFKRTKFIVRLGGEPAWERYMEKNNKPMDLQSFFNLKKHWSSLIFWTSKIVLSLATKIIVPSVLLKNILVNYYQLDEQKIVVINNPLVNQIVTPKVSKVLRKTFLFIGRLINLKNIIFLTENFIKADLNDWRLVIVGAGKNEKQLKKLAEKNTGKIVLAGKLSKSEIIKLFREVDCLLLPSFTDVFPNVVMEAISYGLPVAVTEYTGLPQTIKDNLFIFSDVTNSEKMINNLKELTTLELINKLSDNLLKIDWGEFKSEKVFNQYLSVLYE